MLRGDNVVIKDSPFVSFEPLPSSDNVGSSVADTNTGVSVPYTQEAVSRVPNLITRSTFESTDAGVKVNMFESVNELLVSLDSDSD